MKNNILFGVLGIVAVLGLFFPISKVIEANASPAGSTFNTAKVALTAVDASIVGSTGTSSSLLNGDASDRIITEADYYCSGVGTSYLKNGAGVAAWTFTAATTSTANPNSLSGNYILNTTVATSTLELFIASTTPGSTATADFRVWKAGSYLTFFLNATNTARCTLGVKYLPS